MNKHNEKIYFKDKHTIGGIYYPKKELISIAKNHIRLNFKIDTQEIISLEIEGILSSKFLYANEQQLIVRDNNDRFSISYNNGQSWDKTKRLKNFKIFQIYPLSNGNYLLGGLTSEYKSLVYLFDKNLKELAKNELGKMCWHAQCSIDEKDGTIMFIEYQNFEKNAPLPEEISIFKSRDYGYTWKKVFSKPSPTIVRHGHTLQADPYQKGHWIATTGDTSEQSKWFLSKDDGESWLEITDSNYLLKENKNRSLSAHRTTTFKITKDYYYFSTDDLMGSVSDYFINFEGERKSSSKFYRATKTEPIKIEKLSNLGIHSRSMIDVGKGYIFITEAKYVAFNSQVFYIDKNNLNRAYFLFDMYGTKRHSGSGSMSSQLLNHRTFYTTIAKKMFLNSDAQTLKWSIEYIKSTQEITYNINNYIKFEEHLFFLDKRDSISNIGFSDNRVTLILKDKKDSFYLLLGDNKTNQLSSKALFELSEQQTFITISCHLNIQNNTKVKLYIQFFNDKEKVSTQSFNLRQNRNNISIKKESHEKYIRLLFKVEHEEEDTIELSDLNITSKRYEKIVDKITKNNKSTLAVHSIKDNKGHTLNYKLNLQDKPHHLPLLVILHGHGSTMSNFIHDGWNVLSPHDNFGYEKKGCWWLGEDNDFFLFNLLQTLIQDIATKYHSLNKIYFYGSSMGGYGAILHSIVCNARAVYANVPQIQLYGSSYFKHYLTKNLNKVMQQNKAPLHYNNLVEFLNQNKDKHLPLFFLCENMLNQEEEAYQNYLQEQTMLFVKQCIILQKPCHLELLPQSGHTKNYGLKEVIHKFNQFIPPHSPSLKHDIPIRKNTINGLKLFALQSSQSTPYLFKPRVDTPTVELIYPLDWSINPLKDRNWCFQLHAWRVIDPTLIKYDKEKNSSLLIECLKVINDWKHYTFDEKKETPFTWYDMSTGLRATKLAYIAIEVFQNSHEKTLFYPYQETLLFLMKKHIEILKKQTISQNNHGIFQVHGLMMLSWLLEDNHGVEYAKQEMLKLLKEQFYEDGFHTENSDKYHWFVLRTFSNLLTFEGYKDNSILKIIENAQACMKWTVFPNNDNLLIGDTDDKERNIQFNQKRVDKNFIMKFFKDSGYLFIRSPFHTEEDKASMLFFNTAYKNNVHRHSDDFNILLYEFNINILVDSGQYAYHQDHYRDYVLSTKAHNTLIVDKHNYLNNQPFYESALKTYKQMSDFYYLKTSLYRKSLNIIHDRVILYKPQHFCIIIDKLLANKVRQYHQCWHFHEELEIEQNINTFYSQITQTHHMKIEPRSINLEEEITQKTTSNVQLIKGQEEPYIQGWRSLQYKKMIKNYALENSIKAKDTLLITSFLFYPETNLTPHIDISIKKESNKIKLFLESSFYHLKSSLQI